MENARWCGTTYQITVIFSHGILPQCSLQNAISISHDATRVTQVFFLNYADYSERIQ